MKETPKTCPKCGKPRPLIHKDGPLTVVECRSCWHVVERLFRWRAVAAWNREKKTYKGKFKDPKKMRLLYRHWYAYK